MSVWIFNVHINNSIKQVIKYWFVLNLITENLIKTYKNKPKETKNNNCDLCLRSKK